jgi:hypothetical protein
LEILLDYYRGQLKQKDHKDHKEQLGPRELPQHQCAYNCKCEVTGANPILCRDLFFDTKNYYYFYTEIKKEKIN